MTCVAIDSLWAGVKAQKKKGLQPREAFVVRKFARALGVSIPGVEVHGGVLRFVDAAEPAEG